MRAGQWSSTSVDIVHVELDVFSGRPNPRWTVDPAVGERLVLLLHSLTSGVERPTRGDVDLPGLGYRGFVFQADGRVWRAWRGLLLSDSGFVADPARSVEGTLVADLPGEYGNLAERVRAEIDRSPTDHD